MYAIMGVTGQIGGVVARTLLAARQPVRAVVRDTDKGQAWADRGCEVALATIEDAVSLAAAFQGTEGVFVLVPPNFDPRPEFPEAQAIGVALRSALEAARSDRVPRAARVVQEGFAPVRPARARGRPSTLPSRSHIAAAPLSRLDPTRSSREQP